MKEQENKMNKRTVLSILTGVLLVVVTSIGLEAQRGQRPPEPPDQAQIKQMMEKLSTALSLTEDQKSKITVYFNSHFKEMETLMKSGGRPDRSVMEQRKKDFETKVKALLTEEQQKKFDEFMKQNGPKQGGEMERGGSR